MNTTPPSSPVKALTLIYHEDEDGDDEAGGGPATALFDHSGGERPLQQLESRSERSYKSAVPNMGISITRSTEVLVLVIPIHTVY